MKNQRIQTNPIPTALSFAIRALNELKASGNETEQIDAMERVLSIIEVGCREGFTIGDLQIPPGQTVDGPTICRIIAAAKSDPTPYIRLVP